MIETLYKTDMPEKGRSECYVLTSRVASGRRVYAFMEEHGKWDNGLMRLLYEVESVRVEEELTRDEAFAMYEQARHSLAERGFIYSFTPDSGRKTAHADEQIRIELVPA